VNSLKSPISKESARPLLRSFLYRVSCRYLLRIFCKRRNNDCALGAPSMVWEFDTNFFGIIEIKFNFTIRYSDNGVMCASMPKILIFFTFRMAFSLTRPSSL
jgi:hypothetical protein